jgi:hypothetical protein
MVFDLSRSELNLKKAVFVISVNLKGETNVSPFIFV